MLPARIAFTTIFFSFCYFGWSCAGAADCQGVSVSDPLDVLLQLSLGTMVASAEAAQHLADKVRSILRARASFEQEQRGLPQSESCSQTSDATSSENRRRATHRRREPASLASVQ